MLQHTCKGYGKHMTAYAGQDQADSFDAPQGAAGNDLDQKASELQPDTVSKPNLTPVLKSGRGHAPSKVGSPRSPRQPGSPIDRKTRAGILQLYVPYVSVCCS